MAFFDFVKYRVAPGKEEEGISAIKDYTFYPYMGHVIHEPQRFHTFAMCSDDMETTYTPDNADSWGDWHAIDSDESFAMAKELGLALGGLNVGGIPIKFASFDANIDNMGSDYAMSLALPNIWEKTSFGKFLDDWGARQLRAGRPAFTAIENYWRDKLGLPLLNHGRVDE